MFFGSETVTLYEGDLFLNYLVDSFWNQIRLIKELKLLSFFFKKRKTLQEVLKPFSFDIELLLLREGLFQQKGGGNFENGA